MRGRFRIFDTHTHVGTALHSGRTYSADQLLRDMDRSGIDRSLVIPFPVVADPREAHDEIGRAVLAHPDRLSGVVCLNPFLPRADFLNEVRRAVEIYGFRAIKLQPQYQPLNPLWRTSDFFFETALEQRLPIICHTGSGIPYSLPALMMDPARRYPDLKIVLAHCGGGLLVGEAIVAADFCPNIYLELSSLMPNHVLEVLHRVPSSRLMIGSDLAENLEVEIGKIEGLAVSDEDKRQILWETGARLLL
ncbi:MAG: amidohydrolase family protein [Acidobacteria bacterium]|nr:amidohydrolase family protein [Acidobacteriota bacterium]